MNPSFTRKALLKRHMEDNFQSYAKKTPHTDVSRVTSKDSTSSLDSGFSDRYRSSFLTSLSRLDSTVIEEIADQTSFRTEDCPWLTEGFDLYIRVGRTVLPVHRSLLAAASDIIKTIIYSVNYSDDEATVISLPNRELRYLKQLIQLIYDTKYRITEENVVGLLNVADEFMVENVIARCEKYLLESDSFTSIELLELAVQYKLEKLRQEASLRVSMIPGIEYSDEFEAMGVEEQNLVLRHIVQRQRRKLDLLEDIAAKRCPYHQFSGSNAKCCFKIKY